MFFVSVRSLKIYSLPERSPISAEKGMDGTVMVVFNLKKMHM